MKQTDSIKLDQFLKWQSVVGSGGQAKAIVQDGLVKVNGEVELRRGKRLRNGDTVEALGETHVVQLSPSTSDPNCN